MTTATALAHPNIAFIKYWGNRNERLCIPSNGSISINLDGLFTRTRVTFDLSLKRDILILNDQEMGGVPLGRVQEILGLVRQMAGLRMFARVESSNNFPVGAGIASSASAFAALALAASAAAGQQLSEKELSRLARRGSGSACRSVPGGFVEWRAGEDDETSFAYSIAPPGHWALADCIAILSRAEKETGSAEGHTLASTSPLQEARIADTPRRLELCRRAIQERDFTTLAEIAELDSNLMHAVMLTSTPRLAYWLPETLRVMQAVMGWRKAGRAVCYTIDAGPNVHVICPQEEAMQVAGDLKFLDGVLDVMVAGPGGPAHLKDEV